MLRGCRCSNSPWQSQGGRYGLWIGDCRSSCRPPWCNGHSISRNSYFSCTLSGLINRKLTMCLRSKTVRSILRMLMVGGLWPTSFRLAKLISAEPMQRDFTTAG
jgi:hypothetical protein